MLRRPEWRMVLGWAAVLFVRGRSSKERALIAQ
jgi:hypothetical protein